MELYVIVPIISFVGGWLGSFVGAYLKKKGQNLATHEDLNKLVEQVAAVTKTTKEIEAKISDEVWGRQRLWEMKRDAFFALVKAETAAKDALITLSSVWEVVRAQPPDDPNSTEAVLKASRSWWAACGDFESAGAQAHLVCGPDVAKQLDSLTLFLRQTVSKLSECDVDYHAKFREEREALLAAVRKDLAAGK
jgi:hypothetical protein